MRISDWSSDVCSSDLLAPFGDGGAGAELALQAQRAVVHLDEGAAERQAEAGALVLAAEPGLDLGEGLQHPRLVVLGDADAGVDDAEAGAHSRTRPGRDGDAAAPRRELAGVAQPVE